MNLIDLYPLTFDEFLAAIDPLLSAYYAMIQRNRPIEEIFHNRLLEAYNYYLIIDGMPECVASWVQYKDPQPKKRHSLLQAWLCHGWQHHKFPLISCGNDK